MPAAAVAPGTSTLTKSAPPRPSKVSAEAVAAKDHDDGIGQDQLDKKVHADSEAHTHSTSSSSASSSPRTPSRALNVSHKKSPRIPFSIPGPSSAAVSVSHSFDEQAHATSSSSSSSASPAAALLTQHLARLPDTSPSGSRRSSFSSLNSHVTSNRKTQNRSSLMSTTTSVADESDGATVSTSRDASTPIGRRPSQDPSQDPPSPLMATRKLKPSTAEAMNGNDSAIGGSAGRADRNASSDDGADHALASRPIAGGTNPHEGEGDPAVVPVTSGIQNGEAASSLRRLSRNLPAASKGQAGHSNVSPEILEDARRVIRPEGEASHGPRDRDAVAGHEEAVLLRAQDEEQQAEEAATLERALVRDEHRNIEMRPSNGEETAQATQSDATALIDQTMSKEDPSREARMTSEDSALKDIKDAPSPAAIHKSPPSPSSSETLTQLDISSHIHSHTLGFEKQDPSQLTQLQRRIKADGDRIKQATEGFLASDGDIDNGKTKRGNRLTVKLSLVAHLSLPPTGLSRMQWQKRRHFRPAVTLLCPLPSLSFAEKGLIGHALVGCLVVGLWIVTKAGIW